MIYSLDAIRRHHLIACLHAVLAALLLTGCRPPPPAAPPIGYTLRYDGIMGTTASFTFYADEARAMELGEEAMEIFNEINERFSTYIPESELSRLNASAYDAPFACSEPMWELLAWAREGYEVSHGAFDISAGPLLTLWGFYRKRDAVPSAAEIEEVMTRVGLNKVVFDEASKTVRFTQPGMMLDSGGVAKGYALDLVEARLAELGVTSGVIDLGGNILVLGDPPPGRGTYMIGVRNPRKTRDHIGTVPMLEQSIATSGDYERFVEFEGKRYSHIMDPRTGYPVAGMAAVTVVASNGMLSDILSTAIFVNKGQYVEEITQRWPETSVLIIAADADNGALQVRRVGNIWASLKEQSTW